MKIGTPKEIFEGENRVAMTPDSALQLQKLGYDCAIESGAGAAAGFSDAAYEKAGVEIIKTAAALWERGRYRRQGAPAHRDRTQAADQGEDADLVLQPGG